MWKTTVVEYFGTEAEIARVLEIAQSSVHEWGEIIPFGSAYRIYELTKRRRGAPKFDRELYTKFLKPVDRELYTKFL